MNELEQYFEFVLRTKGYLSLNTVKNGIFSKNTFVYTLEKMQEYVAKNNNQDCYCTYNTLKTPANRKFTNVESISCIALDVELVKKSKPEKEYNLTLLKEYLKDFLVAIRADYYMLVCSGNGFHLYIPILPIYLNEVNNFAYKEGYKSLVYEYDLILRHMTNNFATCSDRVDIGGILRIPGTFNTSANRKVSIDDIKFKDKRINEKVKRKLCKIMKAQHKKAELHSQKRKEYTEYEGDLMDDPIVDMIFDTDLPEPVYGNWHMNAIFALQGIVNLSNIRYTEAVREVELEYMHTWNALVNLNSGGTSLTDVEQCYGIAYKFAKENGYTKHSEVLKKWLSKN